MTSLEAQRNVEAPRHIHPGIEVGYVLEGWLKLNFGETAPKTFKRGESFTIPLNEPHTVKIGPNGVKLLNTFVVEKDKPYVIPVP